MHPILFRIPLPGWKLPIVGQLDSLPIYSYGVMLGLSLVVGWYLTLGLCQRDGLPRETMANNYVLTALSAVLMSRVLYVVTNLHEFNAWGDVLSFRKGGLVAYGGFLGGFLGSWIYLRLKRIPLLPWADVAVPSLASGLAITRVGCYLFGCDFGRPLAENAPGFLKTLGSFPHWPEGTVPDGAGAPAWLEHVKHRGLDPTATHSLPVHPTQIYESLVGIALLGLLLWARKRQSFRGQIFFLFTFTYGTVRFLLELVRDDPERGSLPFTMGEHVLIPIALVLFAIGWVIGPSRMIESMQVRRVTHALAFAPAVIAAVVMRPASFAPAVMTSLSTSQFIGLASALAVAVGYAVLDTAAQEHPETAMDLGLPEEPPVSSPQSPAADAEETPPDAEGERISSERSKPARAEPVAAKKAKKKSKKKVAAKREPEPED